MTTRPKNRRLRLGKIATAHGVRGLLKIMVLAEDPKILNGTLFTSEAGADTITLTMKNSLGNKGGKFWLAEVAGISDRTAAEKLRGTELWRERADLAPIENADEYYATDLAGLKARDENSNVIGTILSVDNFGAGDLLDIQPATGESFYLPFTKENIIAVDIAAGTITIALPEGIT